MPIVNNSVIEALRRCQLVTEYIVVPQQQFDIANYQIKLTNIPSISKEDVIVVNNGKIIPHWVENVGTVWAKISNLYANRIQKIYVLTGNPSAVSTSNGNNTFIQWHGSSSITFRDAAVVSVPFIYETTSRRTAATGEYMAWGVLDAVAGTLEAVAGDQLYWAIYHTSEQATYKLWFKSYNNGAVGETASTQSMDNNVWYKTKIVFSSSTLATMTLGTNPSLTRTTNLPDALLGLSQLIGTGTGEQKYSFIRKYAAAEPRIIKIKTFNKSLLLKNIMR